MPPLELPYRCHCPPLCVQLVPRCMHMLDLTKGARYPAQVHMLLVQMQLLMQHLARTLPV